MEQGTPGRDPLVKGDGWRRWFLMPPYPGWLLVSIGVLSFIVTVTLLAGPRSRPSTPVPRPGGPARPRGGGGRPPPPHVRPRRQFRPKVWWKRPW